LSVILCGAALRHSLKITGKKPTGMRTPSWDFSPATMKLAREFGLLYDSNLMLTIGHTGS
jgi:peptidoglycan/xylan/chitin deacetylase (PgdA/CDA1 family)